MDWLKEDCKRHSFHHLFDAPLHFTLLRPGPSSTLPAMSRGPFWRAAILLLACFAAGCFPGSESNVDEQKEPHFLAGRARVNSRDFKGAVDEFEKAIEVNPRSAAAHFELGWLCEEQLKDYPAAIYHYQKHLQLRPDSGNAVSAKARINGCKIDLAREVGQSFDVGAQRAFERLNSENSTLKRANEILAAQLAARGVTPATGAARAPAPTPTNSVPATAGAPVPPSTPTPAPREARPKSHRVVSGENVTGIARQYGIKLTQLLAANPSVDPRRLKVGQILTIPEK